MSWGRQRSWFPITWLSPSTTTETFPLPHYGASLLAFVYLLRISELRSLRHSDLSRLNSNFPYVYPFTLPCPPPPPLQHYLRYTAFFYSYPHSSPAASAFTTYKSEEKLRFIINLRPYNCLFPTPPSFSLPRFEQILSLPSFKQLWFVKLDIQNCFWSLVLPCSVTGQFFPTPSAPGVFPSGGRTLLSLLIIQSHIIFNHYSSLPHSVGSIWTTSS